MIATSANSQWYANGAPNVVSHEFVTTGGITYYKLVALLPPGTCCQRVAGYQVTRQSSALRQVIQQETWMQACVTQYCDAWLEEWASVLGPLAPGDYSLMLLAHEFEFGSPVFPRPWANLSFTVPLNSGPTLTFSRAANTNDAPLQIEVAGVPNVNYVLEFSTDLATWTALKTNLGPATFSEPLSRSTLRFYRVGILAAPSQPMNSAPGAADLVAGTMLSEPRPQH